MIEKMFAWWSVYRKSSTGVLGLAIFLAMIAIASLAPVLATHDPRAMSPDSFLTPSTAHLLGTTATGQDVFSQLLYASRISLIVGIVTAAITNITGVVLGITAGYFGGWVDEIIMRITDIVMILPTLPLLIIMASFLGPGIPNIILVISLTGWTGNTRSIRALALSLKRYSYVDSVRALGAGNFRIIWQHILPNILGVALASYIMSVTGVILLETGLSFLGFGDPLRPSWGQMLYFAQGAGAFSANAWWWWIPPGLCITVLCFAMAFIGMDLNDRFVLRLRRGGRA